LFMLSTFLSFDYFKHVSDPKVVSFVFDSSSFFGIPMPADVFLQMYKNFKITTTNDERLRIRTQTKAQTWSAFRNYLHKG
jgi:hypothetical protein